MNWNASSWKDSIDWGKAKVWEPRILEALTLEQIEAALQTPLNFPKYPCHSQTVERMVKLVTEVSSSVFGEERQQDKIVSVLASRKSRKAYDTKKRLQSCLVNPYYIQENVESCSLNPEFIFVIIILYKCSNC